MRIEGAEWNYEQCVAHTGTVVCGKPPRPTWWCADFEGEALPCVRVQYQGMTYYLFNDRGQGEGKVLNGGGPDLGHSDIPVDDHSTFEETE